MARRMQSRVQPCLALAQDMLLPFGWVMVLLSIQGAVLDPFLHPGFVFRHGQVPVAGLSQHRLLSRQRGARVDKVLGQRALPQLSHWSP